MWSAFSSGRNNAEGASEDPNRSPPSTPQRTPAQQQSSTSTGEGPEADLLKEIPIKAKELLLESEEAIAKEIEEEQKALETLLQKHTEATEEEWKEIKGYEEMLETNAKTIAMFVEEQKALESAADDNSDKIDKAWEDLEKDFKEGFAQVQSLMGEMGESLEKSQAIFEKSFGQTLDDKIAELENECKRHHLKDQGQKIASKTSGGANE